MRQPLRDPSWAVLVGLALAKLFVHLATSDGYGHFRDELYYLASTDHLAWGYVEHPPLSIALLWLWISAFGDSLLVVRFLPALAGAATVVVAGLIAREFGGGRRAQGLAALCALASPFYLGIAHFYSMNAFDVLAWALLGWIVARVLTRDEERGWLWFGLVAGVGLLNKVSVGFLGFGVVVGLVLTPARRYFASPWLWLGGLVALVVFAPHLLWQLQEGWPTLEFQANARADKNLSLSFVDFSVQQLQMGNPVLLPLWLAGAVGLLASRRLTAVRSLGVVYPTLFLLFFATNGKAYYLAPLYSILYAAGAVVAEPILSRSPWRFAVAVGLVVFGSLPAIPVALPILSEEGLVAYSQALGIEAPALENHEQSPLPQSFADMHGWQELVEAVDRAAAALPAGERDAAVVLATNYGEAGAIEVLGVGRALPPVVCGHNSYWEWRPAEIEGPVIALRRSREELLQWFESVDRVGTIHCEWCMPFQNDSAVHVARGLKIPVERFWMEIKRFI